MTKGAGGMSLSLHTRHETSSLMEVEFFSIVTKAFCMRISGCVGDEDQSAISFHDFVS